MAEPWTPRLTRGLWGLVQRAVAEGYDLAGVRAQVRAAGEAPDAATLSHLYARAVGASSVARAEADYAARVDAATYAARRPSGKLVARLPEGFSMSTRWRQVVRVTGTDPLTGQPRTVRVNVQSDRLLSRGEAMALGIATVEGGSPEALEGPLSAEYESTWTTGS